MSTYTYSNPIADLDAYEDSGPGNTQLHDLLIELNVVDKPQRDINDDERLLKTVNTRNAHTHSDSELEEDDDDDDDDDALEALRRRRLDELQLKQKQQQLRATQPQSHVKHISPESFPDEVLAASTDGTVVMLVSRDDAHKDSVRLEQLLDELSVRHSTVKFVRMLHSYMLNNVPLGDCPILLAYRNQRVVAQFAQLQSFGGAAATVDSVEWRLAQRDVLSTELERDPLERQAKIALKTQNPLKKYPGLRSRHSSTESDSDSD